MIDRIFDSALGESTGEVLERMFFICDDGAPVFEGDNDEPEIAAWLTFEGSPPGWLELRIGKKAARSIAADFLGEEEESLTDRQAEDMACELANMICGSVLSRTQSDAFRLSSPAILPLADWVQPQNASVHQVPLPHGALTVLMKAGSPICLRQEKSAS